MVGQQDQTAKKALRQSGWATSAKGWMIEVHMNALDRKLCRAHEIFLGDLSDETDAELARILPVLVDAGYVEEYGHSPTGSLWRFTESGISRGEELGCL